MKKMRVAYFGLVCACAILSSCVSTNTSQQKEAEMLTQLTSLLVGEFDSIAQTRADEKLSLSKEQTHGRVNRLFIQVDAPKLGDIVLVGSTRYNGYDDKPWYFDKTEFLVWTFKPSKDGQGVIMSPRRFKDLEERIPFAQNAQKLAGFSSEDLEPAISGAACDILWTPTPAGFSGESQPCVVMSTTQNELLSWHWIYTLGQDEMMIEFDGRDKDGKIKQTTPPGSPYHLDRVK